MFIDASEPPRNVRPRGGWAQACQPRCTRIPR